jgi:hypothetical protein
MTRGTHSWVLEACCAAPALPPLISDLAVNPMIGLSYEPNPKLRKINDEHSFMQPTPTGVEAGSDVIPDSIVRTFLRLKAFAIWHTTLALCSNDLRFDPTIDCSSSICINFTSEQIP